MNLVLPQILAYIIVALCSGVSVSLVVTASRTPPDEPVGWYVIFATMMLVFAIIAV